MVIYLIIDKIENDKTYQQLINILQHKNGVNKNSTDVQYYQQYNGQYIPMIGE